MAAEEKKRPIPKNVTPKGQRRTRNPCILSDGSVDPKCKGRYQRSVAGREKLDEYVKRLDSQGASEKDVFMAAVNSLMKRGHGYVGAYLDGQNPGRTYKENEAMAIADAVMTKAGVGSHPGERLSSDEEGGDKEERAQKRESAGPRERGPKAMSVRQQRKQPGGRGKDAMGMPETWARSGTGVDETTTRQRREDGQEPIKPGDIKSDVEVDEQKGTKPSRPETKKKPEPKPVPKREGGIDPSSPVQRRIKELGKPVEPTSEQQEKIDALMAAKDDMDPVEWAKSLQEMFDLVKSSGGRQREELRDYIDRLAGKGKREAAPLPGSAKAQARDTDIELERGKKEEKQGLRQKRAQEVREEKAREAERQREIEEDKGIEEEIPIDEETAGIPKAVDDIAVGDLFRDLYRKSKGLGLTPEGLIAETTETLNEDLGYNLTADQVGRIVSNRFGKYGIDGEKVKFKDYPKPGERQPEPGEQQAQPQPSQSGGGKVSYTKPNFQGEWDEAKRYPEFESAGPEEWMKAASKGSTQKYSAIQDSLGNVDLDYDSLEEEKKQRFEQAFQSGKVEAPIAVRFEDGTYDLVAGNTRLSGLVKNGQDPTVWVVDVKDLEGAGGEGQEAPAPTREALPEERLGRKSKPATSGKGFGAQKKIAESAIRKRGERVLADVQKANELQRRMENSPLAQEEEMGDFIRNKLPDILAKFTPQEKKRKSSDNKSRIKELMNEGMSSSQALAQIRKETGVKPKSKAPKRGEKTSDNSEYGRFAEAVRQVVRMRSAHPIK